MIERIPAERELQAWRNLWNQVLPDSIAKEIVLIEPFVSELFKQQALSVPNEPGYYTDRVGDPWRLAANGHWYDKGYAKVGTTAAPRSAVIKAAPFRRLIHEGE